MNTIKKLLSISLSAVMVLSLASCSEEVTPEEVFDAAMLASTEVVYSDISAVMDMSLSYAGESMDTYMEMDMLVDMSDEESLELYTKMNVKTFGTEMELETFYVDGYQYTEMMGMKQKMAIPIEEMMQTMSAQPQMMYAEDLKELSMTEENDNKVFDYVLNEEMVNEIMSAQLASMGMSEISDIRINDMSGSLVLNSENEILTQKVFIDITTEVEGQAIDMSLSTDFKYNSYNQPVEITFPDDLASYTEVTM